LVASSHSPRNLQLLVGRRQLLRLQPFVFPLKVGLVLQDVSENQPRRHHDVRMMVADMCGVFPKELPPSEKIASELNSGAQARKTRIKDKTKYHR